MSKKKCEIILEGDYDRRFWGTVQISSNQKNNPTDSNNAFSINFLNGVNANMVVLDSIIMFNDVPNINQNNFRYTLNGTNQVFTIGQYNTITVLLNSLSASLSASAGHSISIVVTPQQQIEFVGTLAFTDTIVFSTSVGKMLGLSGSMNNTVVLNGATPVFSTNFVPNAPVYSRWANVMLSGMFEDRSFTYSQAQYRLLSCVPLGNFGDQVVHREVEYRPLTFLDVVSSVQVQILDEHGFPIPLGSNSVVINLFYK